MLNVSISYLVRPDPLRIFWLFCSENSYPQYTVFGVKTNKEVAYKGINSIFHLWVLQTKLKLGGGKGVSLGLKICVFVFVIFASFSLNMKVILWKYEGFDAGDKTKDGGAIGKCSKACQRNSRQVKILKSAILYIKREKGSKACQRCSRQVTQNLVRIALWKKFTRVGVNRKTTAKNSCQRGWRKVI